LIGSSLLHRAPEVFPRARLVGLTRNQLDLTDPAAVSAAFRRDSPQAIVHCAAMSRSPDCQADPAAARRVNVLASAYLARLAAEIPFVFLSSDLVFDGRAGNYEENVAVNPLSVYAETKAEAEHAVLANPNHLIIRTSLNGGTSPTGDRGFNEQMRLAWQAKKTLKLFTDEFRSPIAADCTALAIWDLLRAGQRGIFHVAGSERMSRWQLGGVIAARWPHLDPKIEAGSLKDYAGAPRPADTSLNCSKARQVLSFPLPGLTEWLAARPDLEF
jgi:dTDP-4-dehydrorhamnose reductase